MIVIVFIFSGMGRSHKAWTFAEPGFIPFAENIAM